MTCPGGTPNKARTPAVAGRGGADRHPEHPQHPRYKGRRHVYEVTEGGRGEKDQRGGVHQRRLFPVAFVPLTGRTSSGDEAT